MEKYLIYLLEKGDTVESLSRNLNITPFDVRGFHNTVCSKDDLIGYELPQHLTELYVSPHIPDLYKVKNLKNKFVPGYDLQCKKGDKKTYGFIVQNHDNDDFKNSVHYEIDVACILADDEKNVFEFNRKQVYINNTAPDTNIEQLLDKAAKSLFPIQISITKHGQIDAIENFKEIKKRWLEIKKDIQEYYKGDIANDIITNVEEIILDSNTLKLSLYKNWFFNLYFSPLYSIYNNKLEKTIQRNYPVFGTVSLQYEGIHKVPSLLSETEKLIINAHGKSIDERTIAEVLNGYSYPKAKMENSNEETVASEFEIQYKLHGEDRSIFSIVAQFKTKIDESNSKISKIEIYEQ